MIRHVLLYFAVEALLGAGCYALHRWTTLDPKVKWSVTGWVAAAVLIFLTVGAAR